ncbi:MAG TPA: phosphopentomutase [Candidatus Ornithoclostridium faecigallinarum]|nr:phosphopentomutase [Candidatus Ornithoclostridium faecigallinarum]
MKTVYLLVIDAFGVGGAPDAAAYGDEGSNTYRAVAPYLNTYFLDKMGLKLAAGENYDGGLVGMCGRMTEKSKGKDTNTGHYELAGLVVETPWKTYPNGFPDDVIKSLCDAWGVSGVLGNCAESGTEIIKRLGDEMTSTGKPIVYTSADSVLQIACNVDVVPLEKLYEYCEKARSIMTGEHNVGRIIARPFLPDGKGGYYRTEDRKDYGVAPFGKTLLDILCEHGKEVAAVGKINDIFCGRGVTMNLGGHTNEEVWERVLGYREQRDGLVFANFVETDMLYGHRNDVKGYADCLNAFDERLGELISRLDYEDVIIVTADHGCDPSTPSTDHSREAVPLLVYGSRVEPGYIGELHGFDHVARLVLNILGEKGATFN